MRISDAPCKECQKRRSGCHQRCESYIDWQEIFTEYGYTSIESAHNLKRRALRDFEKIIKKQ